MRQPRSLPCIFQFFRLSATVGVFLVVCGWADDARAVQDAEGQVIRLGPGVYDMDRIVLDKPHALLEGAGRGVTIVRVPGGIIATAPEPVIRNLTIVGNGTGVGLTLRDVWTARVDDVEIESYGTGIVVELTTEGVKEAGGKTQRQWPGALTPGHWGSRVTLTEMRGVEVVGKGDGIVLRNLLPQGNKGKAGEFFTATTFWGGHIKVEGHALIIGESVWNTKLIGTFIDAGGKDAIVMEGKARRLTLIAVAIDLSNQKKERTGANKLVAMSNKAARTIEYFATNLKQEEIIVRTKRD